MQSEDFLVSVVIPYFNKERTIYRSVNSVIQQTYKNWEIIIIDDCSSEKLVPKEKWENLPITLIQNERNLGPGPTRQRGMSLAIGTFIAFLDADDWWDVSFLMESVKENIKFPEYAGTWAVSRVMYKDRIELRRYSQNNFELIRETILKYPRPWQTGSILWKREHCGKWGDLSTSQDYYFELSSSINSNKLKKVDKVLYFVDQTQGNHRIDIVNSAKQNENTFYLYKYFVSDLYKFLSIKNRILLFHRLLRALLKITESLPKRGDSVRHWRSLERIYPILRLFFRRPLLLKIAHKTFQRTPFKIHF